MLQPLPRADVPLSPLLDLSEDPRLDEGAAPDHDAVDAGGLDVGPVVLRGVAVAPAEDRDLGYWGMKSGHCEGG